MKSILFLRGNSFENYIGATDIEIAFALTNYYDISILSKSKKFVSQPRILHGARVLECFHLDIPFIGALLFYITSLSKIKQSSYDILITDFALFPVSFMYKQLNPNSLVIVDIRSIPIVENKFRLFLNNLLLKLSLKSNKISGVTIITESMKEYLIKKKVINCQLPIACWGSGVNKSLFNPYREKLKSYDDLVDDSTIIIYHGSLTKNRGISNLIKSIDLLIKDGFVKVKLLLVGDGIHLNDFKDEVEMLGLENHVIFTGIVSYDQIPDIIILADLAIIPFPDIELWRYQSPLKMFEYLAMGVPIIATDIPPHRNISQSIVLIPNNNPDTIKEHIIKFLQIDADNVLEITKIAIEDSKKYTWEKQAEILSNFLEQKINK